MLKKKQILIAYRLVFGLLALSAIATEIIVLVQRGSFVTGNFFSFFTIESNLFAAIVLLYGVFVLARSRTIIARYELVRGAATLYMLITGIIFALLLSGLDAGVLTAVPWDNTVLHYIMPLALLGDWLLDPPAVRIAFKRAIIWLVYPAAYLIYTLVRGSVVNWYPYPFLNVNDNSYASIAVVGLGISVLAIVMTLLLTRIKAAEK